jgi:Golgi-body localisation protein domain
VMDGKEFEVVADVVSLLLTPGPSITTITAEEKLLGEGENEEVEDARFMFANVRQRLLAHRQDAIEIQRCLGMTLQRSGGSGGGGLLGIGGSLREGAELHAFTVGGGSGAAAAAAAAAVVVDNNNALGGNDVSVTASADFLPVMTAMREHLAGEALAIATATGTSTPAAAANADSSGANATILDAGHVHFNANSQPSSPGPTTPSNKRNSHHHMASTFQRRQSIDARRDQLTLLLRWVQEQESKEASAYSQTKSELLQLKTAAGKQQVSRAASRVLVQLDRIVWQLCSAERTPFVQAALRGLTFDTRRNRDHSGSAKFIIHRVDIIDATGNLSEGPVTPAGVILACWNPDASYEREPVVRVVTTMGVPTRTHTVFEHLDASLHPLSLHLTENIAVACWEYFFPKEDSKSRQEAFNQSVGNSNNSGSGGGGGNQNVGRGRRGSSVVVNDAAAATVAAVSGGESPMAASSSSSGMFGTSPLASGRSSFADYPGSPPAAMGGGGGSSNASSRGQSNAYGVQRSLLLGDLGDDTAGIHASAALFGGPSGGSTPSAAAASSVAASRGPFRGGGGGGGGSIGPSSSTAGAGIGGGNKKDKYQHQQQQQQQQQQHGGRTRKRFVYVKLNRAHMRITYQGYPIGIKDRILVINSYTCENLDGRWRDLLANVKQKAILSAVWSGLGLQGRKIRELMDGAAPAVPSHQSGLPGEDGRGAKGLLAKMGLAPKARKGEGAVAGQPEMSQEELKALSKKRALFGNHVMKNMPGRPTMPASATAGASTSAAATAGGAGGTKSGATSAKTSPSGSAASTPRVASHNEKQPTFSSSSPSKKATGTAPTTTSKNTSARTAHDDNNPQHAQQLPSTQHHPSSTAKSTYTASTATVQQPHAVHAVPVLDLQRPLPPEAPADAIGDREPSLSPLEAGIVAAATGRTGLLGSPTKLPRSAASSPTKKFSLSRADSNVPGGSNDPITALLGQAFQQQQQTPGTTRRLQRSC